MDAQVYVYYWDGRDGSSFEGWWFGKAGCDGTIRSLTVTLVNIPPEAVGGNEVWSHC